MLRKTCGVGFLDPAVIIIDYVFFFFKCVSRYFLVSPVDVPVGWTQASSE